MAQVIRADKTLPADETRGSYAKGRRFGRRAGPSLCPAGVSLAVLRLDDAFVDLHVVDQAGPVAGEIQAVRSADVQTASGLSP